MERRGGWVTGFLPQRLTAGLADVLPGFVLIACFKNSSYPPTVQIIIFQVASNCDYFGGCLSWRAQPSWKTRAGEVGGGVPFLALVIVAPIGHRGVFSAFFMWEPCVPRSGGGWEESDGRDLSGLVLQGRSPSPVMDCFTIPPGFSVHAFARIAGGLGWDWSWSFEPTPSPMSQTFQA